MGSIELCWADCQRVVIRVGRSFPGSGDWKVWRLVLGFIFAKFMRSCLRNVISWVERVVDPLTLFVERVWTRWSTVEVLLEFGDVR